MPESRKTSGDNPTSIRFIFNVMEKLGYGHFQHHKLASRDKLQQVYCYLQYFIFIFFVSIHFLSTVTRSIRYLPEFFQNILEDAIFIKNIQGALVLFYHSKEVNNMVKFMETSFSKAIPKIAQQHKRKAYVIYCVYMFIVIGVFVTNALERYLPLSEEELETRYV